MSDWKADVFGTKDEEPKRRMPTNPDEEVVTFFIDGYDTPFSYDESPVFHVTAHGMLENGAIVEVEHTLRFPTTNDFDQALYETIKNGYIAFDAEPRQWQNRSVKLPYDRGSKFGSGKIRF